MFGMILYFKLYLYSLLCLNQTIVYHVPRIFISNLRQEYRSKHLIPEFPVQYREFPK